MVYLPELFATAPACGFLGPSPPDPCEENRMTTALGNVVLVPLLTTLPVNFCGKGKFVTANWLVSGVKWPTGLDSLYKYLPPMFWTKSPFWKFNVAVMAPAVAFKSPG